MSNNVEIIVTKQKQLVIKLKVPSIKYPYFAKIFKLLCKIEIIIEIK